MYNVQVLADYKQWYRCVQYKDGVYARELHVTKLYFADTQLFGVCMEDMDYVVTSEVSHVDAMKKLFGDVNLKDDGSLIPCLPDECAGDANLVKVSLSRKSVVVENKRVNDSKRFVLLPMVNVPGNVDGLTVWYGYVNCYKDDIFDRLSFYKSGVYDLFINVSGRYVGLDKVLYSKEYTCTLGSDYVYLESDDEPYYYSGFNEIVMA